MHTKTKKVKSSFFGGFIGKSVLFTYYGVPHSAVFMGTTKHVIGKDAIDLKFSSVTRVPHTECVESSLTVTVSQIEKSKACEKHVELTFRRVQRFYDKKFQFAISK